MELQHKVCNNNQKSTILNFSSIHKIKVKCSHDQEKKSTSFLALEKKSWFKLGKYRLRHSQYQTLKN